MTIAPFMTAPFEIQIHAVAAMLALTLGPVALYRERRDRVHKILGYIWITAMALVALSSFFISGFGVIGPFSPLHLLALLALWGISNGTYQAIKGNIIAHKTTMRSVYWYGVVIAGLFNFLPGRMVNRMLFNDSRELGYIVLSLGIAMIMGNILRRSIPQRA